MRFKQLRFGPRLLAASRQPGFFDAVHVAIGGTGAVGGATVWQWISMYEEALSRAPEGSEAGTPRLLVTARTKLELRGFTRQLFRLQQRDHRADPEHVEGVGYRTAGGVLIDLRTFGIDPAIEGLSGCASMGDAGREAAVADFLASAGLDDSADAEARASALELAVAEKVARPFSDFLSGIAEEISGPGEGRPFRSVVVGIPMASVATYKLADLEVAGPYLGIEAGSERMERLKDAYLEAVVDDLAQVSAQLSDEVLVAHTTAVGGMYDEDADGQRQIRLGFAHSAKGHLLRDKQSFARKLTALYSARDIKMLITAAAIGVDAVLRRERVPTNGRIKSALARTMDEHPELLPEQELAWVHTYPPHQVPLEEGGDEAAEPLRFEKGRLLLPEYMIRSGENGFFSVPNADALYRVMRVTSATELGLVLARTAVLGDDTSAPRFVDNIYYYTETDNSRQVFDLLADPPLLHDQLSGLSPNALQDLGSAKHQAELHALGLVTLLMRLRVLDLDEIPRNGDPAAFQPAAYFEAHSPALTIERAAEADQDRLAANLRTLVTATEPRHLYQLLSRQPADQDRELVDLVLAEVLNAVWTVTSLGTPILVDGNDGAPIVLVGPYAAPLDLPLPRAGSLHEAVAQEYLASGGDPGDVAARNRFGEFLIAGAGFCDLRAGATLVTARTPDGGLEDQVFRVADEHELRNHLESIEPYTYFATSGLAALLARLRGMARMAADYDLELGSANEWRSSLVHDATGRALLVPGVAESFRMVWEGLEKNTGTERLDGAWGYPAGG